MSFSVFNSIKLNVLLVCLFSLFTSEHLWRVSLLSSEEFMRKSPLRQEGNEEIFSCFLTTTIYYYSQGTPAILIIISVYWLPAEVIRGR